MSERMRIVWTICAIAAVGIAAFIGLRALASGSGQSTRESGLVVPSQSEGAAAQSDPGEPAPPAAPEPTEDPAQRPADPAPAPVPVPARTAPEAPYQVTPSQPQRATSDDDDDHDDHDDDRDDD